MNFRLLKCFTWDATLERNSLTKIQPLHIISAHGRMIRPNSARRFGVSPDDRAGWSGPGDLWASRRRPGRMIRPYTGWSGPWNFSVCLAYSVTTPDDPRLPRMIRVPPEKTQRSLSGVGVYIPLHPPSFTLSISPTNLDSKTLNPPLLSI
jgi:hypothetical protein